MLVGLLTVKVLLLLTEHLLDDGAWIWLRPLLVILIVLVMHRKQVSIAQLVANLGPPPLLRLLLSFNLKVHYVLSILLVSVIRALRVFVDVFKDFFATLELPRILILDLVLAQIIV